VHVADSPPPLTLREILDRLAPARSYWLATIGLSGAPHLAPVWGAVCEGALHVYSERSTAKARNLAGDDRVSINLEDAEDVLIVTGCLEDLGRPQDDAAVLEAFAAKYDRPDDRRYLPSDRAFDVLYRLVPERALAWTLSDFDGSQRRWVG